MSTSIDAPPAAPGSPDGPEDPVDRTTWLQQEMARRMAERASGGGGRHARRDGGQPPRGVDHVPRHSVATPGPGTHRPAPIGGPALPGGHAPADAGPGWSGPEQPGAHPAPAAHPAADDPADPPAADRPVLDHPVPDRRGPGPGPDGGVLDLPAPVLPAPGPPGSDAPAPPPPAARPAAAAPRRRATDLLGRPLAGPAITIRRPGPAAADPVLPAPTDPDPAGATDPRPGPRPAEPDAPPADPSGDDLGGPSRPSRVPRAFRRTVPGRVEDAPAVFGGPRFSEPAPLQPYEPPEPDVFGGPGFSEPAARNPLAASAAADGAALGLELPEQHQGPVTIATGPAADVVPPLAPARLLAAPPPESDVETTVRITAVRAEDDDDEDDDGLDDDLDDGTVLWSRDAPDDEPRGNRVTVVISERRNRPRAVRTVESIQEVGAVGELLRGDLIRSQLRVALRFALGAGLVMGLLPLAFALFPVIGQTEVFGFRLPWILLGVAVYPFLYVLGWWHTRTAERVEHEFAERVQD